MDIVWENFLENMPFDRHFENDSGECENCHATGREVCFAGYDPYDGENWWNEYIASDGSLHYGR